METDKRLKSTRWMPWDILAKKDVEGHERVRLAAKRAFDPHVSEWGNPRGVKSSDPAVSEVAVRKQTEGIETSQYLQEEKSS